MITKINKQTYIIYRVYYKYITIQIDYTLFSHLRSNMFGMVNVLNEITEESVVNLNCYVFVMYTIYYVCLFVDFSNREGTTSNIIRSRNVHCTLTN